MPIPFYIYDELRFLGITPNYKGCRQAALAIELVLQNEDSLNHITKIVYQAVAEQIGCSPSSVERNIRTVALVAWKVNPSRLKRLAGYPLFAPPSALELITILSSHVLRSRSAQEKTAP